MDEGGYESHQSDEYRKLMIHLMVGSLYRDDKDFITNFLYSSPEIQIWIYLKLSTYEYSREENDEQMQENNDELYPLIDVQLPSICKSYNIDMLRQLAQQTIDDQSYYEEDEQSQIHHIHYILKLLFFSGQFSQFLNILLQTGPQYLIASSFMSITLSKLGLISNDAQKPNYHDFQSTLIFIHHSLLQDENLVINKQFLAYFYDENLSQSSLALYLQSNPSLLKEILKDPKQPSSLIEIVLKFNENKSLDIQIQATHRLKVYEETVLGLFIQQREFIGEILPLSYLDLD